MKQTVQQSTFLSSAVLGLVAAVHGASIAQSFSLQPRGQDDLSFWRMFFMFLAFALMQVILLPVWGALSDRFGRWNVINKSLALTVVSGLIAYAPLFRLPFSFLFILAIASGLAAAGVVLSSAYSFSLITQGSRAAVFGSIVSGFFIGCAAMLFVRYVSLSLLPDYAGMLTASVVILMAGAAIALVRAQLIEVRRTTDTFTGMNALHSLWHGFGESNRLARALIWKIFLGLMGLSAGLFLGSVPMVAYAACEVKDEAYLTALSALIVFFVAAAGVSAEIARWSSGVQANRLIAPVSALLAIPAALPAMLGGSAVSLYLAAGLTGLAAGLALFDVLNRFQAVARDRSAGAEVGAVVAIWVAGLSAGLLFAMTTRQGFWQLPLGISAGVALLSLIHANIAVRR